MSAFGEHTVMTRIVFMGTPQFAVPSLNALVERGFDVVGVITQPDRPVGRGHKLAACPVKERALELGLDVYQFDRLRSEEGVDCLRRLSPDAAVTAAFGQILDERLLSIPKFGIVNVHASLLPKHRGAAPINWAILQGDAETGVTLMRTARGIDTGDMYVSAVESIKPDDTAETLTERLSVLGGRLLGESLGDILAGRIRPVPQDEQASSYDPMLKKEMGAIDWTQNADAIDRQVRGLKPWPGTYTAMPGGMLKVHAVRPAAIEHDQPAGTVLTASASQGLIVACGQGAVELVEIQAPNAKRMSAKSYLAGKKIPVGLRLGVEEN